MPREEKQTLVGQVFASVAPSYDIMNDLMSGGLPDAFHPACRAASVSMLLLFNRGSPRAQRPMH